MLHIFEFFFKNRFVMQNPSLCNQHRGKYSVIMTTCPAPLFRFPLVGGESENRVGGILFWSLWVKKHTAAFAR
jgi:hypothetical protein